MRIALLSALEPLAGGVLSPRGLARIGGRTVLQNQLQYALASGCKRIACLSHDLPSELIALQHEAERAGAQFQCIRDAKPLSGLVTASDEVLVLGDGLAFDATLQQASERKTSWIASFPAEEGISAGFERIDRDRSWAGIMMIPGALVEKLADFPSDIDVQSSLLRLALQSGVKTQALDEAMIADGNWVVIESEAAASEYGAKRLGKVVRRAAPVAPVHNIADFAALTVLRRHSDPERASRVGYGVAGAFLVVAALAAYFVQPLAGFAAIICSVFAYRFSETTAFAVKGTSNLHGGRWNAVFPIMADIALLAAAYAGFDKADQWHGSFAVIVVLGIIRIGEIADAKKPWAFVPQMLRDRGLIAIIAMIAIGLGYLLPVIQGLGVVLLIVELARTYRAKLTQV